MNDLTEEFIAASPAETYDFAIKFAGRLKGGDVVLLDGGLGAGKTLFAKGVAQGLGYDPDEVTSPSFALVNQYPLPDGATLYHLDLYRLDDTVAAYAVGLDEILLQPDAITLIEWGARLKNLNHSGGTIWQIEITGDGDEPRSFRIYRRSFENASSDNSVFALNI